MRRAALCVYGVFIGALVAYLALGVANLHGYFCAALVAALGFAAFAVGPDRALLYAVGVVLGLAALTVCRQRSKLRPM